MRPSWLSRPALTLDRTSRQQRRRLLTLAIETSCDDTSVAIIEKIKQRTTLHFHSKVTSDNRQYGGIHPVVALNSHQKNLSSLVRESLQHLPAQKPSISHLGNTLLVPGEHGKDLHKKPDFVTVTRGPGMRSSLQVGIDTAKGLAVAWQVPLLGINHMQAHALTPRLVSALGATTTETPERDPNPESNTPEFPFLTLLVSGGHTMLVESQNLCEHEILANTCDIAIGDVLDKCARDILPASVLKESSNVMYGRLLEEFAFPEGEKDWKYTAPSTAQEIYKTRTTEYGWSISAPFSSHASSGERRNNMEFSFSGIGSKVKQIVASDPPVEERRVLARETMRVAFEHLLSRLMLRLFSQNPNWSSSTASHANVVLSGGVASNRYLLHMLSSILATSGRASSGGVIVSCPPPELCTDNAAMIAWVGIEMWEAGFRSSLDITALRKWAVDSGAEDGGILGVEGWERVRET